MVTDPNSRIVNVQQTGANDTSASFDLECNFNDGFQYTHHCHVTTAISEPEQVTQRKSKTVDRGLGYFVWFVHNCSWWILAFQTGVKMTKEALDAKAIYNSELKESLERDCHGQYVAIVSETHEHYVRPTFLEAALAARTATPEHIPFVIRIGYQAAFHIGAVST